MLYANLPPNLTENTRWSQLPNMPDHPNLLEEPFLLEQLDTVQPTLQQPGVSMEEPTLQQPGLTSEQAQPGSLEAALDQIQQLLNELHPDVVEHLASFDDRTVEDAAVGPEVHMGKF